MYASKHGRNGYIIEILIKGKGVLIFQIPPSHVFDYGLLITFWFSDKASYPFSLDILDLGLNPKIWSNPVVLKV